MNPLLDNIAWNTLSGAHAGFATGTDRARRYAPGFSPIVGFAKPQQPDLADLAPFCEPGDHFYCMDWSGSAPAGWQIDLDSTMFRMVWQGALPDDDPQLDAVALRPEHAAQAVELAALTRPGPFGPRTPELGDYFGCFEGDRLIAMAGERMCAGTLREISGVCTHPDFQGRGLARRLAAKLIRRQLQRGETPFLHVMRDNEGAHALYARMGFRDHREVVVRVISPC
ncbi:GNAT family N-acetyltransferase [Variovorax saccharolyticus]|uniref:GNAT family N-acetyltransferase n=1 Tax=Variovorax saccharolyticus TaxID=3053516 RepID=UPI002578FE0E|nr:GNAT family N-acetyltransferase [Variovorax sp. J31P216]MDM0028476.1 GNAT family N-acetyltransferase [Variovorax sp. J31P216]